MKKTHLAGVARVVPLRSHSVVMPAGPTSIQSGDRFRKWALSRLCDLQRLA